MFDSDNLRRFILPSWATWLIASMLLTPISAFLIRLEIMPADWYMWVAIVVVIGLFCVALGITVVGLKEPPPKINTTKTFEKPVAVKK